MTTKPTATIYHDTRRAKKNGTYPVKLRVYFNNESELYRTKFDLTEEDFQKSYLSQKPRDEKLKEIKLTLHALEQKAGEIIDKLSDFSFEGFEEKMFGANGERDVYVYYSEYISKLKKEKRFGTASSYELSEKSIKAYSLTIHQKYAQHLPFSKITPDFLEGYERWNVENGKSKTTAGIYLRALRTLFNLASSEKEIEEDIYPFGKGKYQIPSGSKPKKAINKDFLKILYHHSLEPGCSQEKARDFWFFSYQCNGINMCDIANLKCKDIEGESIIYYRQKTIRSTKGNLKPIIASKTGFLTSIIEKHGNPSGKPDDYVFAIIDKTITEEEKRKKIQNFTRFVNQHIKALAKKAGIPEAISTYWARHSFTTNAIRDGATMEYIQDSLGHQDMATTMNYWEGFEGNAKKDIADKLMDFD